MPLIQYIEHILVAADMSETKKRRTETESSSSAEEARVNRLPHGVLAVAARNKRNRFFIPDTNNSFGGISFDYVMMDSGCSSILLPFPPDPTVLEAFSGEQYRWQISFSRGAGAVGSLVLKIQPHAQEIGGTFSIELAGKAQPFKFPFLRIHLGSAAVTALLPNPKLGINNRGRLQTFLDQLGGHEAKERRHVLLGQLYFQSVFFSAQVGGVIVALPLTCENITKSLMFQCSETALTLAESVEGFDDLEDDDHDGDDEEYRFSWDWDDCVDEIDR